VNYIITNNPSYFQKVGKYNYCKLQDMQLPETIGVDLETEGLDSLKDDIFSVQIGTGKDNYLIDLQKYSTPIQNTNDIKFSDVVPYIKDKTLIGHNIAFDLKFFYMKNFFPDKVRDTMIASKILHNGEPPNVLHSFGAVMERELNIVYDKSEQKNIHKIRLSTPRAIQYCFNDVDRLIELENVLFSKIAIYKATESYELNCDYLKVLAYMELCGLPINTTKWKEKMAEDIVKSREKQLEIIEYIYDNLPQFRKKQYSLFNTSKEIDVLLSSPRQVIPIFEALSINVIDDEGKKSINESVINKTKHEFVDLWLKYKESEHRVTTFGQKILDKVQFGHLYSRFNPIVDTCRISSRKGEINFLNFPADKTTRKCFEASPGYVIVGADFANQESRILADITGDKSTIDTILLNLDTHSLLAREVYPELKNLSDSEIKLNHNEKRQEGKIGNFTISFGGNGYTIAKNLNKPIELGNKIYEAFKSLHKELFEWGESMLQESLKKGYIQALSGFMLKLPMFDRFQRLQIIIDNHDKDFWTLYKQGKEENKLYLDSKEANTKDPNVPIYQIQNQSCYNLFLQNKGDISEYFSLKSQYFRLCLNNPIQNIASHQTKQAAVYLFDEIKKRGHLKKVRIANIVHDEFVLEVKEELAEEYKLILQDCMIRGGNKYMFNNIIKADADAAIGKSWGDVH
jgi:DNA polymerase I